MNVRSLYRRILAGVMLFTAEAVLAALLFFSAIIAFLTIAKYVADSDKNEFDSAVFGFLHQYVSEGATNIMLAVTTLGNYPVLVAANLVLTFYFLFVRRHRWYSIKIASIALSSVSVMSLLKLFFNRSRPLMPLLEPARGLSFPSGHAMSSITFFGLIIYYVYRKVRNKALRIFIITLLILTILLIGVSRVYLRVHYASDVLAGYCAGIVWLITSLWLLKRIEIYSKQNLNQVVEADQK